MLKNKIICVGNSFIEGDDLGPRVYQKLMQREIPSGVEVVDGGLMGLNLLSLVEGADKVVFVDSVRGFGADGEIVVMEGATAARGSGCIYGHSGGLGYLLNVIEATCPGGPEIIVVGSGGKPDERLVSVLADKSVELASGKVAVTCHSERSEESQISQ